MSVLLIDGDILAYKAAWKAQESIDWGDDESPQELIDMEKACLTLEHSMAEIEGAFNKGYPTSIICFSDHRNWRKELCSSYKANRADQAKPLLLDFCKKVLRSLHRWETWPRLEADDVMGILATEYPSSIMVSIDKDMRNVPGKLYNPDHPEEGVITISEQDAFYSHMFQTLTGDSTDGYKGCPGIGPKKAKAALDSVEPPKNGKGLQGWKKQIWIQILKLYHEKGLAPADALLQARLSNILTTGQYHRKMYKVKLWQPPR